MLVQKHIRAPRAASPVPGAARGTRAAFALALLVLQATLAGCALTDHTVGTYHATRDATSSRAGLSVTLEYAPTMASDPDAVGVKKSGCNATPAPERRR